MTKTKKLKCNHCKYMWNYKGTAPFYTACPRCMYRVNITKQEQDAE